MVLSNDERGWVMTCLSGVACALGAAVICVDLIIRLIPSKRKFRIQDSDTFMSISLSLSFGVMLFSALYSMLPSAKKSLIEGGNSSKAAAWILIACFIGGVVGIQILSRALHHFMPSHVVDCEHSHEEEGSKGSEDSNAGPPSKSKSKSRKRSTLPGHIHRPNSHYALPSHSSTSTGHVPQMSEASNRPTGAADQSHLESSADRHSLNRKPSIPRRMTQALSEFTSGKAAACECDGPCFGYTDPCGNECFKKISDRGGFKASVGNGMLKPALKKSETLAAVPSATESTPLLEGAGNDDRPQTERLSESRTRYYTVREDFNDQISRANTAISDSIIDDDDNDDANAGEHNDDSHDDLHKMHTNETTSSHNPEHHHHHVPTNAFLSIGLQTSIAIALHKLPEGFITYATNHANPQLGVAVFLALFIHNITEGFAMALPLYLAIQSRAKAMIISFALGGLSQPLGAAVAAVWFRLAGDSNWAPDESVYGGMFAVTAGIMASVGLQLFSESLDLTHSKTLCFVGAFCGMTILGISSALTA